MQACRGNDEAINLVFSNKRNKKQKNRIYYCIKNIG